MVRRGGREGGGRGEERRGRGGEVLGKLDMREGEVWKEGGERNGIAFLHHHIPSTHCHLSSSHIISPPLPPRRRVREQG